MAYRVLVIDQGNDLHDHGIRPADLPGYQVRTARDRGAAELAVRDWTPDVAITVAGSLAMRDIAVMWALAGDGPGAPPPFLLVCEAFDAELLALGVRAGARGFLGAPAAPQVVQSAIKALLSGGGYLGPEVAGRIFEGFASAGVRTRGRDPALAGPAGRMGDRPLAEDAAAIPQLLDALSDRLTEHFDRLYGQSQAQRQRHRQSLPPPTAPRPGVVAMAANTAGGTPQNAAAAMPAAAAEPAAADALTALRRLRDKSTPADGGEPAGRDPTLPLWLAEAAHRTDLAQRLPQSFARLRDHPALSGTLACWLVYDCDVRRVATAMHVHPNTIRYRLSRVEEIIQRSLSATPVLTALYLTVLAFPAALGLPSEIVDLLHESTRR